MNAPERDEGPPVGVLERVADPPEVMLRYAERDEALLDLHLPRGSGPHRLVIVVHGGFWKPDYDRVHVRPMARALVEAGCLVATVEYRRLAWPVPADDVDAALTALPGLLAGLGLATTSTTLTGHSAGGQLVLWLAARGYRTDRLVALAPVADLLAGARDRLGDGAVQTLLGGEPAQQPERYAAADPLRLLTADTAEGIMVLHGTQDDVVPPAQSRGLVAAHPAVRLVEIDGADHLDLIDPLSAAWPQVLETLAPGCE